ncbi:ABC transporter ATP-binding protein [Cellulosilyticum ruminicola]|uniref:ABC transporter ATP-binding protein n=1 Tax=Cellulosilyticum ruminicola TaxID=425254 RepID=UPI0006D1BCF5|nr:ABC transporter ATP-binding protein [Cellulosilyticum ruminicola]
MNTIEVINLKKDFSIGKESISVLKEISFNIQKEDFVSIMGPSGCGKSTLLYILGGLDKPTDGVIKVNGKDLNKLSEKQKSIMKRREMGFVFQFYNLVPNLSVEDNILLPIILDKKGLKKYKKKLDDILDIIELNNKRKNTPRELSGGQQQRVAIARALVFEPEIILADEPIGNLDSKTGTEIMKLFKEINKEFKTTIVQVTHSEESAYYGNKIIRLKDGVILREEVVKESIRL